MTNRKKMQTILKYVFAIAAIVILFAFQSCEKPPTNEEAKRITYDMLIRDGYSNVVIHDYTSPSCSSDHRYCFSFSGIKVGYQVQASISWSKETRIFIVIDHQEKMD